jgi:hypothetical protein
MLRRATLALVATAAVLPLGGTAHASCLDDAKAGATGGWTVTPKSPYWSTNYVQRSGTATVTVQGDAAVSDWTSYAGDGVRNVQYTVTAAPGVATGFVDCVAG